MSFSGGVYTLPGPALVTGEVVSATENNQFRNDVAGAFNLTFLRNGTSTATANLPMGGYKLTGLGVATTSGDALSYGQAAVVSDITATGSITVNSGTANGVAYLNGSKVLTAGSALTFDGTTLLVGTVNEGNKLTLSGTAGFNGTGISLLETSTGNNARLRMYQASGVSSYDATYASGGNAHAWLIGGSEQMRLTSTGLGIGTSSPASKLDVVGALRLTNTANAANYGLLSDLGGLYIQSLNSNPMYFATGGSERMRIDSSGNLLVGTTTIVARLAVSGSTEIGRFQNTSGTGNVRFVNSSDTTVGYIQWSGSTTAYVTSSDYRLKENIKPMQNALDVVQQLNPVTYTWKADGSDGQGFIAHELQAVVPDCVTGEKDATRIEEYEITPAVPAVYEEVVIPAVLDEEGNVVEAERTEQQLVTAEVPAVMGEREVPVYQGIDTSFLVATLTKAIQELAAKVDAQQAEIDALKNAAA